MALSLQYAGSKDETKRRLPLRGITALGRYGAWPLRRCRYPPDNGGILSLLFSIAASQGRENGRRLLCAPWRSRGFPFSAPWLPVFCLLPPQKSAVASPRLPFGPVASPGFRGR